MAKIVIEEINRLGHVVHRYKFDSLPVTVGRAYNNDLILSDPHVAPEHFTIQENHQGWLIEDLGGENAVRYRRHGDKTGNNLASGDEVIVGRSRLRLFSPWHPVHAAHPLPNKERVSRLLSHPWIAAIIVLTAFTALLLNAHLETTNTTSINKLIAGALPAFVSALFWAGIWTFVGRVITHRANFLPQFIATILFILVSQFMQTVNDYLTFVLSSTMVADAVEFVVDGFALAMLLRINFENSTNLAAKPRAIVSHGVAWSGLLLGLFMQYANQPSFSSTPKFPSALKPPFAQILPAKSFDDFLAHGDFIFNVSDDKPQ